TPAVPDLKTLLAQRLDLKPEHTNEGGILLALEQGQEARRTLALLLEALGTATAQAAAAKVAELMKDSASLAAIQPEYDAMKKRVAEIEASEADAEVDRAMQAHAMP